MTTPGIFGLGSDKIFSLALSRALLFNDASRMDWTSAPSIEVAPPEPAWRPIFAPFFRALSERVEGFLERERPQLAAWVVVAFGAGILGWFMLPDWTGRIALASVAAAIAALGAVQPSRLGRAMLLCGLAVGAGLGWMTLRNHLVSAPVISHPGVHSFEARVVTVEARPANGQVRLTMTPLDVDLPPRVRVTYPESAAASIEEGARVRVRARLQPPPQAMFPGTHDFARDSWFKGIGAVGRGLGTIAVLAPGQAAPLDRARRTLEEKIAGRLDGAEAGLAIALATGTQAAVPDEDADAMRRSGLTHLLSVSGLHIAAVVGAAMFLALRLLALSEALALRFNLVLVSAGAGAVSGIGYTLLTGMQVPTVRSCVAALLVLLGIALGREAISIRLIAVGALVVLLAVPESVVGVSFQLSFAAVTAIVALHRSPFADRWLARREEGPLARLLRSVAGLVATGLAVELALMPLTLFHFHKAGLYAVGANLFAIPWTTFVVMPLEFVSLLAEPFGVSAPLWKATGWAIGVLLGLARSVASAEGAVATLSTMPAAAFALMAGGGLWLTLWEGAVRRWGLVPVAAGALWALSTPPPDLLVSGDGRHVALLSQDGRPMLLRERTGDFALDLVRESSAFDGDPGMWEAIPGARCSADACLADVTREGRSWRILAIRSRHRIRWEVLTASCAGADIVVAERRLPRGCTPRWLKLDRAMLERTGGVAVRFGDNPSVDTVARGSGDLPWRTLARGGALP